MSTLAEVEAAIEQLPIEQQLELYSRFGERLEASGAIPQPRDFSPEQIAEWLAEDERQGQEIREMFRR